MLTPQQETFFNKHLKKSKWAVFSKKKNAERQRLYEAYLQLQNNVLNGIANLPESVASQKPDLLSEAGAVDATVKDKSSLGDAFDKMQLVQRKVNAAYDEAQRAATRETPMGQIMLMVNVAINEMIPETTAAKALFENNPKLNERLGDSSISDLLEYKTCGVDASTAINAVRTVPGAYKGDLDDTHVADAKARIKAIRDGWEAASAKYPDIIKALTAENTDEFDKTKLMSEAKARLDDMLKAANPKIMDLERWDAAAASALRAKYDKLSVPSLDMTRDFVAMESEGTALFNEASRARSAHLNAFLSASAPIRKRISDVSKASETLNTKKLKKEQTAQFYDLLGQCVSTIQTGNNIAILGPLEGIVKETEQLLHDLQKAEVTNAGIVKGLAETAKLIKGGLGSKAIRQEDRAAHVEALTKLNADWPSMPPMEVQKALLDLKTKVRESIKNEEEQQTWRKERLVEIKAAEQELEKLNKAFREYLKSKGEKKADYQGTMAADLAQCRTWTTTKEHRSFESTVEAKLADVDGKIYDATSRLFNDNTKIELMEKLLVEHKAIEEGKEQGEKDRQALLTDISNFEASLKPIKKENPAIKTHPDDMKQIMNTLKQAKDAAKKGGNTPNGQRLLKSADDMLSELIKKPPKLNFASLGKMGANWKTAFDDMTAKINELNAVVVGKADTDEEKARAKKLADQLKKAQDRMKPDAFNGVAAKMGAESTSAGDRKAAREVALSLVRSYREVLPGDPLMKMCAGGNPFGVKSFGGLVHKTLREIELEVLRGV